VFGDDILGNNKLNKN